jgi:catechol 2,3-dioxygenase-like lactoylglutathione lyase family enzyme
VLDHLDLNVGDLTRSATFYEAVLGWMGYAVTAREPGWMILAPPERSPGAYVTLVQTRAPHASSGYHRKRAGVNHLAFRAPSAASVEELHAWLLERSMPVLYGGPMRMDPDRYAVFFEDPDRLKLEYVHRGDLRE